MKQISEEQAHFLAVFVPTSMVSTVVMIFAFLFGYEQGKIAHSYLRDARREISDCTELNQIVRGVVPMTKATFELSFIDATVNNWSDEKAALSEQIREKCKKQAEGAGYKLSEKGIFGLDANLSGSKYR